MAGEMEAEALGDVALKHLDGLEFELDDLAAGGADQVVVMLALERALVVRALPAGHQRDLQEPRFDKERQHAIDRRGVNIAVPGGAQVGQQIVGCEVTPPAQGGPRD